ncbi:hypothetical protein OBBRIDRAFT_767030 [Obba rivulosa]|uniref:NUDE domain-containing protein n=1 Tax=Obba rivulosa TaxID=1052685 RepID=A0A8E2DU82_9APHY|nr:hypothetical protein OBBRIDRAFT_767030 [Obba rivulosa]
MPAVLQTPEALKKDRAMATLDENTINYSSSSHVNWEAKFQEASDMLAETRAELEDFQQSSKDLEEEMEREILRTEKAQMELQAKVAKAERERDDWKSKFMSLQTTHNKTTTSLQRELDMLRQEHQQLKVQLRELEMGNDDLERNERAISSSLMDTEVKYNRVLEEKILLEHELLDKAKVEEECQRLKDDLRDANEEIRILKDQVASVQERLTSTTQNDPVARPAPPRKPSLSDEDLLSIHPPPDLQLSELSPDLELTTGVAPDGSGSSSPRTADFFHRPASRQATMLQQAGFQPPRIAISPTTSSFRRAESSPAMSTATSQLRRPAPSPIVTRGSTGSAFVSTAKNGSTGSVSVSTTKSKGVQMVSELRIRVKELEQRIHTRVPRIRMGSVTSRTVVIPPVKAAPPAAAPSPVPSASTSSLHSTHSGSQDSISKKSRRSSINSDFDRKRDSNDNGWVMLMQDSPTPVKEKRKSSPIAPSAFRGMDSTSASPTSMLSSRSPSALSQSAMPSGLRRPQSRLSEGRSSVSTNATTTSGSSILTPASRPSTPTHLPIASPSLYGGAGSGLKIPGQVPSAFSQSKRLSYPAEPAKSPATTPRTSQIPAQRPPSRIAVASSMSQSRIGRPGGGVSGRRSGGEGLSDGAIGMTGKPGATGRARSGSTMALTGRGG